MPPSPVATDRFPETAQNAFRILGLPGNASLNAIRRERAAIPKRMKVGLNTDTPWDLPLLRPVDRTESGVHEAFARLTDPVQRIRERLFWFVEGAEVLKSLTAQTAYVTAVGWDSARRPTAAHDSALLKLIVADVLDPEFNNPDLWTKAVESWSRLKEDEGYWLNFYKAEADFEPKATPDDIEGLRWQLLTLVAAPLARTARQALLRGDCALAGRILTIGCGSQSLRDTFASEVLAAQEESIEASCSNIACLCDELVVKENWAASVNRSHCEDAMNDFETTVQPQLNLARDFLTRDSELSRRIRTTAAHCLQTIAMNLTWADEYIQAETVLLRASELAHDTSLGPRLLEDLNKNHPNADGQRQRERRADKGQSHSETQRPPAEASNARPATSFTAQPSPGEAYDVTLPIDMQIRVPTMCICCLGPAESKERASVSYTRFNTTHTYSLDFPVCKACESHRKQFLIHRIGAVAYSVVLSFLISLVFSGLSEHFFTSLLISAIACSACTGILSVMFPLKWLNRQHASRTHAVNMLGPGGGGLTIRFWHPGYAQAFASANGLALQSVRVSTHGLEPSIMRGKAALQVCGTAIALSTILIMSSSSTHAPAVPVSAEPMSSESSPTVPRTVSPPTNTTSTTALKQRITDLKSRISALESQIADQDRQLSSLKQQLDGYKLRADLNERLARSGNESARSVYNQAINNSNSLVPQYNAVLSARNQNYSLYESLIAQYNQLVDQYNH